MTRAQFRLILLISLAGWVAGCSSLGTDRPGVPNFGPSHPPVDQVYRGGQPTRLGVRTLSEMGFKTIINLRDDAETWEASSVRNTPLRDDPSKMMTYIAIGTDCSEMGTSAIDQKLQQFIEVVCTCPKPVYVHCYLGRDRTGLFVAVYRQVCQGMNADQARAELAGYGHSWPMCWQVDDYLDHRFEIAKFKPVEMAGKSE